MMNYKSIAATIELLATAYPNCFSVYEQRRKPLKIGIHTDILAASEMDPKVLSAALRFYCMNIEYLKASCEGATRIDLNGEPCGTVTAQEAAGVTKRLEQLNEKHKRQQKTKEQTAKNKGRLTLEDLRKAARARRAA